ncbi:MAG: hypothetical protein J7494_07210 [Sphingobium sp.]|nr:hypothetical protein [Sphingobium sp.]
MRKTIWIGVGLIAWLAAQTIALGMTGAGHGTYPPLFFSAPLIFLYPTAFIHLFVPGHHRGHRRRQVLAAALLLDVILLACLLAEGNFFLRMWRVEPVFVTVWIALWLGWQGLFALPPRAAIHGLDKPTGARHQGT